MVNNSYVIVMTVIEKWGLGKLTPIITHTAAVYMNVVIVGSAFHYYIPYRCETLQVVTQSHVLRVHTIPMSKQVEHYRVDIRVVESLRVNL